MTSGLLSGFKELILNREAYILSVADIAVRLTSGNVTHEIRTRTDWVPQNDDGQKFADHTQSHSWNKLDGTH